MKYQRFDFAWMQCQRAVLAQGSQRRWPQGERSPALPPCTFARHVCCPCFLPAAAFPSLGGPAPSQQQNGIKPGAPTVAAVVAASIQKRPVGPAAVASAAQPATQPSLDASSGEESRLAAESSLDSLAAQLRAMGLQDSPATLTPAQSLQVLQQCAARSIPQPSDTQWQSVPQRPRPPPVPIPASYPMQVGRSTVVWDVVARADGGSTLQRGQHLRMPVHVCHLFVHHNASAYPLLACDARQQMLGRTRPADPPPSLPCCCSGPPSLTRPPSTRSWMPRRCSSSSTTSPAASSSTWRRASSSGRRGASTSSTRPGSRWGPGTGGRRCGGIACAGWVGRGQLGAGSPLLDTLLDTANPAPQALLSTAHFAGVGN